MIPEAVFFRSNRSNSSTLAKFFSKKQPTRNPAQFERLFLRPSNNA
ncbi:hypothetical protein DSM3645_01190 [Blastopirellula marina DSM 3645]|uniref:Uncharacterized protein n=1 Tax=Blastopirellula marina DSM 3645 TaxID=314230 RepID=A3ZMV7_9BACT|nr:hypothetical protein DSM3645_01190 [Blastopirellula marina DSM 3645]